MPNNVWYEERFFADINAQIVKKLNVIGEMVEGAAKVNCPVDTGNLRSSISNKVDEQDLSVTIGTPVEYAPFVELGTYKMKAQPFLRPALIENRANIKRILSL